MIAHTKHLRLLAASGFSLVELMVAMVAGLIVIGAVVVFTIATAKSATSNIHSTRVMQELRSSLNLIEREIRRSGYDQTAYKFAGNCVSSTACPVSNFNTLVVDSSGSCVVVSYDNSTNSTAGGIDSGEFHAFRRVTNANGIGVIQTRLTGSTAPTCADAANDANWQDVSNPNVVDITALSFTQQPSTIGGCLGPTATGLWIVVQDVLVQIDGQWVDRGSGLVTKRSIEESVRVKNDRVSTTRPATSVCPS